MEMPVRGQIRAAWGAASTVGTVGPIGTHDNENVDPSPVSRQSMGCRLTDVALLDMLI